MNKAYKILRLLLNTNKVLGSLRSHMAGKGIIGENRMHIEAGVKWLLRAQEKCGGGFSRKFSFYGGWDKAYIETTGYIIPTMLAAGKYLGDEKVIAAGKKAAEWLLGIQKENGAYCDTDTGEEQVFDTGQVLTGLIAAFVEWGDERFLSAAVRAGTWITAVQEKDGSWERHAYNGLKHAYYVKVAAALLKLAVITGHEGFRESGLANIRWTLGCQADNGFFEGAQFRTGERPFLHTIAYVLEGLMDSYEVCGDREILGSAMRAVSALRNLNRDRQMVLSSQYDANWQSTNDERCLTGLAQWAGIAVRAHEISPDQELLDQAVRSIYYLKSKQYLKSDPDLHGALPGSVPLWGKYMGFSYPNWALKFFLDALLAYDRHDISVTREQETWVRESFRFADEVVGDELNEHDRKYLELFGKAVKTGGRLTLVDAGCGKGKFVRHFKHAFPDWHVTGIDPEFSKGGDIIRGSVYKIPLPDGYADVVLLVEVMQHVEYVDRAMSEISRVTKPGGTLVIADREKVSIIGLLKPLMETGGFWMYPWDSPFRERWRSVKEWRGIFGDRWLMTFARSFGNPGNRIPLSNRFYLLAARKTAE